MLKITSTKLGDMTMRLDSSTAILQSFALATFFTFVAATWVALGEPANHVIQPIGIQFNASAPWALSSF